MSQSTGISTSGRYLILASGFFGWLLAGVQLAVSSLVMRDATKDLLQDTAGGEADILGWFGWLTSSFLLGGAVGGYLFGNVGDRWGRKKAMAISIFAYSLFAGLSYFVTSIEQLFLVRFLVGLGVGGMWPNGIALVSEAWPNMSRPMLAGVIGTAANVGIMCFSILTVYWHVTPEDWRWVMQLSAYPVLLGAFVWIAVPESQRWKDSVLQGKCQADAPQTGSPLVEVFRPPVLALSMVGIVLGTIPLFGGWGSANWANAWAAQVGDQPTDQAQPASRTTSEGESETERDTRENDALQDPGLKARALLARSGPGSLASLLGGAIAALAGRRRFYFFLCVACLACSQYLFLFSHPSRQDFLWAMAALGLFSGFFFGWLPLCLPELFPTRVRATGAGVSFNFGRIATAIGILVAAGFLKDYFDGDYAKIGRLTSWIYLIGAVAIWFAPDTSRHGLRD